MSMRRVIHRMVIAAVIVLPLAVVWVVSNLFQHVDDAYAQWGAADMVMHYMDDHGGEWPRDWESLAPYFERNNGRVSGWTFEVFQSRVFIDFGADPRHLRRLSQASSDVPFDVIHATSIWASQFDGGPNEMLYQWFRDVEGTPTAHEQGRYALPRMVPKPDRTALQSP